MNRDSSAAELAVRPFQDVWDWVIVFSIFLGIGMLAYVSLRTTLFDHWIELARQGSWSALMVRPHILWFCMGRLSARFSHLAVAALPSFPCGAVGRGTHADGDHSRL